MHLKKIFQTIFLILFSGCANVGDSAVESCFLNSAAESAGKEMPINDTTFGGDEIAQSFVLSEQKAITKIQLKLQKVGMTAGDFTGYTIALRIQESSGGKPTGTQMNTSDATVSVTTIQSAATYYTFTFSSTVTLAGSITYWLRARGTYPASNSNYIKWIAHDGIGGYSDGSALYETVSGDWQSSSIGDLRDLVFKIGCQ